MKALKFNVAVLAVWTGSLALSMAASGGEADTSASARRGSFGRPGTATGTAHYEGDTGFARTDTRTGAVNESRSVALGVDEDGLALSVSTAVAPNRGPAMAANFNLSIGEDGDVSGGFGLALGRDRGSSTVAVAGGASTGGRAYSTASAAASPPIYREIVPREVVRREVVRREVIVQRALVRPEVIVKRAVVRPEVVVVQREIPTVVRREVEIVRTPARVPGRPTVIREFGRAR